MNVLVLKATAKESEILLQSDNSESDHIKTGLSFVSSQEHD